ncbi:MAG: cupin domain-containing protein [Pseudomonadales bacterium]|nr:cupin domain-containing protein [Pseudomonadales bacterium]
MLNMDFSQRVVLDTNSMQWVASPASGVWRKPLARQDKERGHATSIVRYDPGTRFHGHDHPGGEEILVLDGVFSDETGDYPAGTYLRNPVGFRHAPFSLQGCLILVKLHQFLIGDRRRVCIDTSTQTWQSDGDGSEVLSLHQFGDERVSLVRSRGDASYDADATPYGEEIYVVQGELIDGQGQYGAGTWIRNPPGYRGGRRTGRNAIIWTKTGHLKP